MMKDLRPVFMRAKESCSRNIPGPWRIAGYASAHRRVCGQRRYVIVRGRECSDLHEIDLEDGGGFEIHVGEVEVRHLRGVPQHKAAARAAHDGHFVHPVELSENFARMHKTM